MTEQNKVCFDEVSGKNFCVTLQQSLDLKKIVFFIVMEVRFLFLFSFKNFLLHNFLVKFGIDIIYYLINK